MTSVHDTAADARADQLAILAGAAEAWEWSQKHLLDAIRGCRALEVPYVEIAEMLDIDTDTLQRLLLRLGRYARRAS